MLQGKCFCEGVRIEIDAPLGPVIACHCSLCRRSTGSAFNPNASVPAERFRITSDQELVHEFSRVPGTYGAFCSRCGSPLYGRSDAYPTFTNWKTPDGRNLFIGATSPAGAAIREWRLSINTALKRPANATSGIAIDAAADITVGSLYHRFGSRDRLLVQMWGAGGAPLTGGLHRCG